MGFKLMGQKCSIKILLVYVYDNTVTNPSYTFTSKEMSKMFGNSTQAAINLIRKLRSYTYIVPIGEEKRDAYQIFRITEAGNKYAIKLKARLEIDDMKSTVEANKAGVTV